MLPFYIFLLSFKIIATALSILYTIKLARLKFTQTYTWTLMAAAFSLRLFTQLQSIYFAESILGLYRMFELELIIFAQVIEVAIISLFLTAILRSYYGVINAKLIVKE